MRNKLKVGQRLYSLNVGNDARNGEQKLTPVVVKKLGRKYFTVGIEGKSYLDEQCYLDTWDEKSIYSSTFILYETEQEWRDEEEAEEILADIRSKFGHRVGWRNFPLSALREIAAIMKAHGQ